MVGLAFVIAIAAAGTPMKAVPRGSPANWVNAADIPQTEWSRARISTFDLTIDEAGKPIRCEIIIRSGSDVLDASVCAALLRRARFRPAKDASGLPITSVKRDRVVWKPNVYGENSAFENADFVVSTSTVSSKKTKMVEIVEILSTTGAVEGCFVTESSNDQTLDALACAVSSSSKFSGPINDSSGAKIRGIRSFVLRFVAGPDGSVIRR